MMNQDHFAAITDQIIAALETGVAPWVKPWATMGGNTLPTNLSSGKAYRGINTLLLAMSPFASQYWVTYAQCQALGGQVRKGETGTRIYFYKPLTVTDKVSGDEKRIPLLKTFTVFNTEQCDGLTVPSFSPLTPAQVLERNAEADSIMAQAVITHGGDRACFIPSADKINLPAPESFADAGAYYATALHEMTHWSGAKSRLNRDLNNRFGDSAYAREELVAELGSAFLCAALGINGRLQHAEYIGAWLKVLKSDKKAVMQAAGLAQKAVDYLQGVSFAATQEAA